MLLLFLALHAWREGRGIGGVCICKGGGHVGLGACARWVAALCVRALWMGACVGACVGVGVGLILIFMASQDGSSSHPPDTHTQHTHTFVHTPQTMGDMFVHGGASYDPPAYVDPYELLSEPTVDPMIPLN